MMKMSEAYTGEYTAIRDAATAAMRDTCKVGTRGATSDGDPGNVTYTYGATIACGLTADTKGESVENGAQATITMAVIRLPWGTSLSATDRIQMVTRAGAAVTEYYAVDGAPYPHLASVRARVRRLTGASVL